jgi:hypothetical protein
MSKGVRRGGNKTYAERDPELVAAAKKLARQPINGRQRTLREVAAELQATGYITKTGKRYAATAVSKMLYD